MEALLLSNFLKALHKRFDNCQAYTVMDHVDYCEKLIITGDKNAEHFHFEIAIDQGKIWNLKYSDNYDEAIDILLDQLFEAQAPQLLAPPRKQLN